MRSFVRGSNAFATAVAVALIGLSAPAAEVELRAPLLVCRTLAGGVRPIEQGKEAKLEHDLIFFVLAGRDADGSQIRQVAPKGGTYLKIDNLRKGMIVKNVSLWKGKVEDGQSVTFALSVREQDGQDSAESDLKEATEISPKIDNDKKLEDLARIPVHEILHAGSGENDHIGTVIVRIKNVRGAILLECEPAADAKYLKGHASNDPRRRAFDLSGDHSAYQLHLSLAD